MKRANARRITFNDEYGKNKINKNENHDENN